LTNGLLKQGFGRIELLGLQLRFGPLKQIRNRRRLRLQQRAHETKHRQDPHVLKYRM
jgi:hypothetical protein